MQKSVVLFVLLFSICSFSQKKLEIFFDFNKDKPNESSQSKINQWVLDNKDVEVTRILGYCDSVDDSKYNKDLAMRRVNSMVAYFNTKKIKIAENAELKSFGKDFKKSKNQSENRKVEVFYTVSKDKNQTVKTGNKTNSNTVQTPFGRVPGKANEPEKVNEIYKEVEEDIQEPADFETLVEEERATLESKFDKAKKGDLIRISNISFHFNSEKIIDQSFPLLDELLDVMLNNPKLVIEIHGHICCNQNPNDTKLSYRRAIVIFKYLNKNGIPISRMAFRGYGSNNPIYKLPEKNEKQRAANRRVEILIVDK